MKRWRKASVDEQRNKLIPILNQPTRYDDPRLNWAGWHGLIIGELDDVLVDVEDIDDGLDDNDTIMTDDELAEMLRMRAEKKNR
jgi:hypothetical protein